MPSVVRPHIQNLSFALALALGACSGKVGTGGNLRGRRRHRGRRGHRHRHRRRDRHGRDRGARARRGIDRDRRRWRRRAGVLPDDRHHADAAAAADEVRVHEHGPQPAGRRHDAGQRSARRRGHGRLQQQRGRADGVVAARGEVRAGVGGAREVGGEEPVDADRHCNTTTKAEDACALDFANTFGRRAFRRPVTDQDRTILMAAYSAGRTGGSYAEGIEVMVRAALQSRALPLSARDDGAGQRDRAAGAALRSTSWRRGCRS